MGRTANILIVLALQRAQRAQATADAATAAQTTVKEGDTILNKKGPTQGGLFEKLGETKGRKKLG